MDINILENREYNSDVFLNELNETLRTYLFNIIQNSEDTIYMIDSTTNEELKISELVYKCLNLAVELQQLGSKPNTVIGIISENRIEYPIITLAVLITGATLTCFNPTYTIEELQHTCNISKPTIMFCSSQNYHKIKKTNKFVSCIKHIILLDSEYADTNSLLFSHLICKSSKQLQKIADNPNDTAAILYSSGTTGYPKGVMLTHKNIIFMLKVTGAEKIFDFDGNIAIGTVPMYHAYGFFVNLISITRGHTLVVIRKFEEKLFLSLINKYKVKFLYLVPPLVVFLLKSPLVELYDLSSVDYIICGAASLNIHTENEIKRKLKLKDLQQAYGMTEATLICTIKRKKNQKAGTCGSILPGTQAKVVDTENGNVSLGANKVGELCFRGPHIMKGYINNEEASAATIDKNGWIHTGDIGYYDKDGDFFIVDRLKELIKYKCYQVAPAELEDLLLSHPDVYDAAVIGIPDEMAGELPKAFIVRQLSSNISDKKIIQYISKKVSPQKRLRGGVTFIEEIPKNRSGKILRKKLREMEKNLRSKY